MDSREEYIEKCMNPNKRNLDRNRGIQSEDFSDVFKRVAASNKINPDAEINAAIVQRFLDSGFAV